jgi:glucose-6-phosphate dehydrogenase assembly protein OpcA
VLLASGFLTGAILSLVMPLSLLAIVIAAWWLAIRRGGLK